MAIAAFTQKGNLLVERGRISLALAQRPGANAATLSTEAVAFFDRAIKTLRTAVPAAATGDDKGDGKQPPPQPVVPDRIETAEDAVLRSLLDTNREIEEIRLPIKDVREAYDAKKAENAPATTDDKSSGEAKPADAPHASMGAVSGDAIDADEPPADKPSAGKTAGDKSAATTVPPKKPVSYKDDLVPLMKARCYECHSGEKPKDGIGFDHMEELIKTTGKRAVVMKGDPAKSAVFIAVMKADTSKKRMPPPKKGDRLTPEEAGIIEAWIKEGAKLDN